MEWGEAIEVNGVRPEWLRDDEPATVKWITENSWSTLVGGDYTACDFMPFEGRVSHIKLPADHPYYTVQAHNAEHGTNFAYWPGGDSAPEDWDHEGVLLRCGSTLGDGDWLWDRYSLSGPGHIIGYTRKDAENPVEDYVSVKRITESEADKLMRDHDYDVVKVLDSLGIILPCTREERFTQETGITVTPDVRAALEWSKEND